MRPKDGLVGKDPMEVNFLRLLAAGIPEFVCAGNEGEENPPYNFLNETIPARNSGNDGPLVVVGAACMDSEPMSFSNRLQSDGETGLLSIYM